MTRSRNTRELDEDDVRQRANPRGTRPRSKQRPAHEGAASGMVMAVDRGRYAVLVDGVEVTAMRARELGRRGIAVGDRVDVVGDLTGAHDTLARIVRIAERTTVLRRTADDNDPLERVIVANADQLLIVCALSNPDPSYGFIDRCLVAALTEGIEPLLCLTKSDLASPDAVIDNYAELSVPALVTKRGDPLDELLDLLKDKESVFVGHSGVGKSTLINTLVPSAYRATGVVSAIGKGRHTSSSAIVRTGARDGRRPDLGVPRSRGRRDAVPARLRSSGPRRGLPTRCVGRGRTLDAATARSVPATARLACDGPRRRLTLALMRHWRERATARSRDPIKLPGRRDHRLGLA